VLSLKFKSVENFLKRQLYNIFFLAIDSAVMGSKSRKLLHEELILQWVVSSGVAKELALANSWFFFELMTKSMVTHLASLELLDMPRRVRFTEQFLDDITSLITMVTSEIVSRFSKDSKVLLFYCYYYRREYL